jgi:hypothetical protein
MITFTIDRIYAIQYPFEIVLIQDIEKYYITTKIPIL